ncbi:hypothetical protein LTR56_026691 [Elasticomyces elasticus]|nr:hypothetical protein LTR22_027582 [Elasticomyces elasticus]KAK3615277.1 hypothetical protein LTR56_026691 [Elasticomyces elasticus]KAK5736396.1 hypothetical protein LTS12_026180 [Elasticomyces elasticus]
MPDTPTGDFIRGRTSLISPENATLIREQHAGCLRNMSAYRKKTFEGRGVVMLVGRRYGEYAVTTLGVLRESGSKLPVEVWRRDEPEEKHGWCDEMEKEWMACRRLSDYLDTDILGIAIGKEMNVFTMLFSSFEEVLLIDADSMVLQSLEKTQTGLNLARRFWVFQRTASGIRVSLTVAELADAAMGTVTQWHIFRGSPRSPVRCRVVASP